MATTRKLIVEISEAHNLFPKDGTGTSSPYARVDFDGQRRKTRTVTRDLNPVWNEALEFNLSGAGGTVLGELLEVSVFHDMCVGSSRRNCFLGRVRLDPRHFVKKGEEALMYFPLEKKSFFGWVRGEIGLKVYYVEEPVPEPVPEPEPAPAPALPQEQNGTDTPAAEATQEEETSAPAPPLAEAEAASAAPPPESAENTTHVPESAPPPPEQPADETKGTENAEADLADQPAVGSATDLNPPPPEQEKVATPQWVPPPSQVPRRQETAPELGATAPPKYDGNISFQGDGVGGSMASAKIGNSVSDGTSSTSLAVPKSTKPGFRMSVSEDFLDDDEDQAPKFSFVQFGASNASSSKTLPSPSLEDLGAKASDTNAVKPVTFGSSPNVSASSATATEIQNAAAPPAGTLTTATTSTGLFSSNVTGHSNSGITNTPTFTFGQAASPLPAPAFQFGAPSGASPAPAFQFGAPLFQPGSSLEFNVGSQVSGSGAGDKANRRIVKVRLDKARRK